MSSCEVFLSNKIIKYVGNIRTYFISFIITQKLFFKHSTYDNFIWMNGRPYIIHEFIYLLTNHVNISVSSSIVPTPPGRAMKALTCIIIFIIQCIFINNTLNEHSLHDGTRPSLLTRVSWV